MDKQELKTKLKNKDFKEGYNIAESIWLERMQSAIKRERRRGDEYLDLSVKLLKDNIHLKEKLK